jgi:hypothetical protein
LAAYSVAHGAPFGGGPDGGRPGALSHAAAPIRRGIVAPRWTLRNWIPTCAWLFFRSSVCSTMKHIIMTIVATAVLAWLVFSVVRRARRIRCFLVLLMFAIGAGCDTSPEPTHSFRQDPNVQSWTWPPDNRSPKDWPCNHGRATGPRENAGERYAAKQPF